MGRLLLACVLGCVLFGLAAWGLGLLNTDEGTPAGTVQTKTTLASPNLGDDLFKPSAWPPASATAAERKVDPVVVLGNLTVLDGPDIAAQIAGQIIFVGNEVPEGAM